MSVVRFDEDKKKWRFDRRTGGTRRVTFHESEKEAQKLKEEFDLAKKGYVAAEKVVRLKRAGDVREATGEAVPIGDALARYSEIEMPKKKPKMRRLTKTVRAAKPDTTTTEQPVSDTNGAV